MYCHVLSHITQTDNDRARPSLSRTCNLHLSVTVFYERTDHSPKGTWSALALSTDICLRKLTEKQVGSGLFRWSYA